ncbi:GNAT family acetyltransferase [Candidatus Neomarinimicrobiota bacterium]
MIDKIKIRPYTNEDENLVLALWRLSFPDAPSHNNFIEDINRKLTTQGNLFFVAFYEEKPIGTAMSGFDGHRGWIYYLAVHPNFRRFGVGKKLMQTVETELANIGCTKLNLQIRQNNSNVVEFYKKLGYGVEVRVSMGKLISNH